MNLQHQPRLTAVSVDNWNEELARTKKFNEAVERRAAEKKLRREGQKVKKASVVGPLMIEM